jgi:RNA recognition motif-containing protein
MESPAEAKSAIDALNNTEFKGRNIIVNVAKPKS